MTALPRLRFARENHALSTSTADTLVAPTLSPSPVQLRWEGQVLHVTGPTSNGRRVMFLSDHGGPDVMESWTRSRFGGHGLWGCIELAQRGYHVLMPRAKGLGDIRFVKNATTDLKAAWQVARTLGRDDIVYCVHNVLWWTPLLARLGMVKARLVAYLFAKEPLPLAGRFHALMGMTRVAVEHAARLNPKAARHHVPWAVELTEHHHAMQPYDPQWGLSCGSTHRDYDVLARAAAGSPMPLKLCAWGRDFTGMPPSVEVLGGVSPETLIHDLYRRAAYVVISLKPDPGNREALGCKQLLEAMALGRPIIKTRSGAMDGDIDVEREGIGLYFEPGDDRALRAAMDRLAGDAAEAAAMGQRGRALCERQFSMPRFGDQLHEVFERL